VRMTRKKAGILPLKATPEQLALLAAKAADEKRARDIVILDLRGISIVTDYFVIADAETEVQVRAITNGILERLKERGIESVRREGWEDARWVLLDLGDAVVHVFRTEDREYYDLERLWGDAPKLVLAGDELVLAER